MLKVEGDLDRESLPALEDTYQESLDSGKRIAVNLENISGVDSHGKEFLKAIRNLVEFIGIPNYLKIEIGD